jgi:CheY-like chemotaxis protein
VSPGRLVLGQDREIPFPKGVNMSAAPVRILVVGNPTTSTASTLKGLARSGWESHAVEGVREARTVLRTIRFQLILATEKLPDGTGYELAPLIAQQGGSLFISVSLSEACLWLPAVERGLRLPGRRALNPLTLAVEAELILRAGDTAGVRPASNGSDTAISSAARDCARTRPTRAAAPLISAERSARQAREGYDCGENEALRRFIPPPGQLLPGASEAAEPSMPLVREDALPDLGASLNVGAGSKD